MSRDYLALLGHLEARIDASYRAVKLHEGASLLEDKADARLWREHAGLLFLAGLMVRRLRRELTAEPGSYRVQAAIVELVNALEGRLPEAALRARQGLSEA